MRDKANLWVAQNTGMKQPKCRVDAKETLVKRFIKLMDFGKKNTRINGRKWRKNMKHTMQEFIDKKIVVTFQNDNEVKKFLKRCKELGLKWHDVQSADEGFETGIESLVYGLDKKLVGFRCAIEGARQNFGFENIAFSDIALYTMEDFISGNIAVWCETDKEARKFLEACEKEGLTWGICKRNPTDTAGNLDISPAEYVCDWKLYGNKSIMKGERINGGYRGCHRKRSENHPYYPVDFADLYIPYEKPEKLSKWKEFLAGKVNVELKKPEELQRIRDELRKEGKRIGQEVREPKDFSYPDYYGIDGFGEFDWGVTHNGISFSELFPEPETTREELICVRKDSETIVYHKINGKVVETASAKCSMADTYSIEAGAKIAIDRLGKPVKKGLRDYKVGDKIPMKKGVCWSKPFVGTIVEVDKSSKGITYRVKEPSGNILWQRNVDVDCE